MSDEAGGFEMRGGGLRDEGWQLRDERWELGDEEREVERRGEGGWEMMGGS